MLKIRLKMIMNVMFIVFVLEVLGCVETCCMESNPAKNEIDSNNNNYQETYGDGCLLEGCNFDDSDSGSSVSGSEKKIIVGESKKYTLELKKPVNMRKNKSIQNFSQDNGNIEKTNQGVVNTQKSKTDNKNEDENVISTDSKNKEMPKADKDKFVNLNIDEEKKKLNRVQRGNGDKVYKFGDVFLTKDDLEYNLIFFDQNKKKEEESQKKLEESQKKVDENPRYKHFNKFFYANFSEDFKRRYIVDGKNNLQDYKNFMNDKILDLIKDARGNYIKYLNVFTKLLNSRSFLNLPLEDGDILYPSEKILSKDYMFALLKVFKNIGKNEILNICGKKNISLRKYFLDVFDKLYLKYKGRIYNNAESLGFNIEEILSNFLLESQSKMYYDMLHNKDLFYYQKCCKEKEVEGYEIVDLFNKMQNIYSFYRELETKINLVVVKDSADSDLIIFIKNPNRYVLKLAEDLKGVELKKSDLGLHIILKNIDKKGIGRKDADYSVLKSLIPILNNIYCRSKEKDILFILINSYSVEEFMSDAIEGESFFEGEDVVFSKNVLHALRKNLLSEVNDKNALHEYKIAKEFEESCEEIKKEPEIGENFFKCNRGIVKYVADVKCNFPKDYLAKDKDIFNFYDRFLTEAVPIIKTSENLDFQKIRDLEIISRNMEDYFQFKIYTDSKDVIDNVKSYCLAFLKNIADFLEKTSYVTPKLLYNLNQTVIRHTDYLRGDRNLDDFFEKHSEERSIKKKLFKEYRHLYKDKSDQSFFDKASAVAFVDWSRLYRGYIPVVDLIVKSFARESQPFSDYYFDIVDGNYIEDYILRICENIKEGVTKFRYFVNLFDYDTNLFKIKIYERNK